ncbi:MAG: histidinol dehydrogenase [Actinomycetales bacterium]|nr:histidinol dehydrogenase [Actinomycetales bacterium]
MRCVDLRGHDPSRPWPSLRPRSTVVAGPTVAAIVEAVAQTGDEAVLAAGERFDGVRPPALRVPARILAEAHTDCDPQVREALALSITRLRRVHEVQRAALTPTDVEVVPGGWVSGRWQAVARAGVYVPGGRAVYPSSVVMNVVPAQVAGVPSIAVASPPQRPDGWPNPTILAACAILGIDEVYAAGGAQAIAMLAHGTGSCPPVDVITGPGNAYVAAAKRCVHGHVGIDAEAGPTEIAIIADETASAAWVAADLIGQAEHDPLAACLLITTSAELAEAVQTALAEQVPATPHRSVVTAALSGDQSAVVIVAELADAVAVANAYAAEHLQILTREPQVVAEQISAAGCIFIGDHSPVPLGDYVAGSNHVLPTAGTARYASGLSVMTFLRHRTLVHYDATALHASAGHLRVLAYAEDLPAHAHAVDQRLSRS